MGCLKEKHSDQPKQYRMDLKAAPNALKLVGGAVHRVARGNDYPTAHAVRAALTSPEYTRIPATATVLRGAIPPRDVSPGAPFAPFRPEDCAPPSPLS